ncbi:MAG: hypothetical protein U0Z53_03420 [Blastocatellia bacterium]
MPGLQPDTVGFYSSPTYNNAINDARFVKGFGITAAVYAALTILGIGLLSGGIGLGVGLFVLRYDSRTYFRVLGIVLMVLAVLGAILPFGPLVLSGAVLGKGIQTLGVLSREGRNDDEWAPGRKRALIGTIAAGVGLLLSLLVMVLTAIVIILALLEAARQ